MPFYKANDLYRATLRSTWIASPADTTLSVTTVPDNIPTIVTVGWKTDSETKFAVTNFSGDSPSNYVLTGVTIISGGTENIAEQTPVNCLNNEEFLNQYEEVLDIDDWYTLAYSATPEIDVTNSNKQIITLTGDATFTVTGALPGQAFILKILEDGTGGHTATLFSGITWRSADYSQNETASKVTIYGFIKTGAATYDGFLVGKDYA